MAASIPLVVIAGPTAVGKSLLAFNLAQRLSTGIISADSRQIYKYMDIGTGKPTQEEQNIVPHYMIDLVTPDKTYSAGEYGKNARFLIDTHIKNGQIPIIAGGTGLYIRAAIDGLSPSPPGNPNIKESLSRRLREKGINSLYNELSQLDPSIAKRLHPNDRQRILRALEVFYITGKRLSDFQRHKDPYYIKETQKYKIIFFFIYCPRPVINEMISKRIDNMFERGLIKEVGGLIDMHYTPEHPGMQSLGYIHIYNYLMGEISLTDAKRLMKRDTQRYAKRQMTWFRQEKRAIHIEYLQHKDIPDMISEILSIIKDDIKRSS